MNHVMSLFRLLALFASYLGYAALLRRRISLNSYFAPMLVISAQICILFVAGLVDLLLPATVLLFAAGLLLLGWEWKKEGLGVLAPYKNLGYLCFFLLSAALYFALCDKQPAHYDDYSHWALIVKQMLADNRLPNAQNVIQFQAYPPGSALYIYAFCKLVGCEEGLWLFAQGMLLMGFLLPLFSVCGEKNRGLAAVLYVLFANLILVYNVRINTLLVDTLLPLVGVSALLFYLKSDSCDDKTDKRPWMLPLLVLCLLIKNSGILFAVLLTILMLYKKEQRRKRVWLWSLAPYVTLLLWSSHCSRVYPRALESKHAFTIQNFSQGLSMKSTEMFLGITENMLRFSLTGKELYLCLLYLALTALVLWLLRPERMEVYKKAVLAMALVYFVYMVGMLLMYLFSMPPMEARFLAGADRYRRSILIVFLYGATAFLLEAMTNPQAGSRRTAAGIVLSFSMIIGFWLAQAGKAETVFHLEANPYRAELEQLLCDSRIPEGAPYALLSSGEDPGTGMVPYICRFVTLSRVVEIFNPEHLDLLEAREEEFDYLILLDETDERLVNWLTKTYPRKQIEKVIPLQGEK